MYFRNSIVFILVISIFSCKNSDEDAIQKIDQTLRVYMQDASGVDYFDTGTNGQKFATITFSDIGGEFTSQRLNSATIAKDSLGKYYMQYVAGATRNLVWDNGAEQEYRSDISIQMFKKDSTTATEIDTLSILYRNTPTLFQVKQVNFNEKAIFTKTENAKNIMTIIRN